MTHPLVYVAGAFIGAALGLLVYFQTQPLLETGYRGGGSRRARRNSNCRFNPEFVDGDDDTGEPSTSRGHRGESSGERSYGNSGNNTNGSLRTRFSRNNDSSSSDDGIEGRVPFSVNTNSRYTFTTSSSSEEDGDQGIRCRTNSGTSNSSGKSSKYSDCVDDHTNCTICLDQIVNSFHQQYLECGHSFHYLCIKKWLQTSSRCPNCNRDVTIALG